MEGLVQLIVPFITLSILSVLVDRLTTTLELLLNRIPNLPDSFEPILAYIFVLVVSVFICNFASFDIFVYLDLQFPHNIGVYLTGIMISQGSHYVRSSFETINGMPSVFSGITSSIKSLFKWENHLQSYYRFSIPLIYESYG